MAGRGSMSGMMPYGDANAIVMDMAREVLPVVKKTPVLAGVCGTDPFRIMKLFLRDVQTAGFSGVQNFPTVGLIDGGYRMGPVTPVDQFLFSAHVEAFAVFRR